LYHEDRADFDVIFQSLKTTTLREVSLGLRVNVERAAKQGAEIGGHPLSGHIDFYGKISDIRKPQNNHVLYVEVPPQWRRYLFAKGYIALNGTSLTISEVNHHEGWFEVWLIPETLRRTTFIEKKIGDLINIEIDRNTQVIVDTVRSTVQELLRLQPTLENASMNENLIKRFLTTELSLQ
jgi:riboflavin synthase